VGKWLNRASVARIERSAIRVYDGTLDRFPQNYHEPYCGSYIGEDFAAIARRFGLMHQRDVKAFVSKVMVFDKSRRQ
jgi:hypothetical protein